MFTTDPDILSEIAPKNRIWQGIASVEVTKKGRVFVCFYSGGIKEENGNFCCLVVSDDGKHFSDTIAVAYPDANTRCFDPCLWIDPMDRLWVIWSCFPDRGVYAVICDDPDSPTLRFGEEFHIGNGVMMNKPIVSSDGEWLFPIAVWIPALYDTFHDKPSADPAGAYVYATNNAGKSFVKRGAAKVPLRSFDEHMLLEDPDDGSLACYVRTSYGVGISRSYDGGYSWSDGRPSGITGPSSRFHIRRLPSGRLLLVNHYNFTGRNNLTALLSDDGGKTWKHHLLLDERSNVSYPDVGMDGAGNLYIVYDRERGAFKHKLEDALSCAREILIAKIREEDILAGKIVTKSSYLKCVVNKLGEYTGPDKNPYGEVKRLSAHDLAAHLCKEQSEKNDPPEMRRELVLDSLFSAVVVSCDKHHKVNWSEIDSLCDTYLNAREDDDEIDILTRIITQLRLATERDITDNIIESVIGYINCNLSKQITLTGLSEKFSISRYYLAHLFKHETGLSVVQFCKERRVALAKRLLRGNKSITDIGSLCGFANSSYFSESFKSVTGMTPSEYRRNIEIQ